MMLGVMLDLPGMAGETNLVSRHYMRLNRGACAVDVAREADCRGVRVLAVDIRFRRVRRGDHERPRAIYRTGQMDARIVRIRAGHIDGRRVLRLSDSRLAG